MSWGVDIEVNHGDGYVTTIEVVDGHTYNLTPMWRKAGVFDVSRDLDGLNAGELVPTLEAAVLDATERADEYRRLNPENGWGDYDGFLMILNRFTQLCWEHPRGTLRWNG